MSNYCLNTDRHQTPFVLDLVCTRLLSVVVGVIFAKRNIKESLFFNKFIVWYLFQSRIVVSAKLIFLFSQTLHLFFSFSILYGLKTLHISDWCRAVSVRQFIRLCLTSVLLHVQHVHISCVLCINSFIYVHDWVTYMAVLRGFRGPALLQYRQLDAAVGINRQIRSLAL